MIIEELIIDGTKVYIHNDKLPEDEKIQAQREIEIKSVIASIFKRKGQPKRLHE